MKLIDKIIKILVNFRYKRQPFMAWSWGIDDIHEINIISAEYYLDHCRYGGKEEYYNEEEEEKCEYISKLSEIRSKYSCFEDDEEPYYRALSEGIKAIRSAQKVRDKNEV